MTLDWDDDEPDERLDYGDAMVYRPEESCFDNPNSFTELDIAVASPPYDSRAERLCFECMSTPAIKGQLRCDACKHKHERRVQTRDARAE